MIGTAPKQPLRLNYFINREIKYYSEKRGYLWPENQQLVEEDLEQFRAQLIDGKELQKARQFYYPYRGLTPFTAKEARYYYDITAMLCYMFWRLTIIASFRNTLNNNWNSTLNNQTYHLLVIFL